MSDLVRIEYESEVTISPNDLGLLDIIRACDRHNAERILTGFLHYNGSSIHQVIEGPSDATERLFTKICADDRHHKIRVLDRSTIASRSTEGFDFRFIPRKPQERRAPLSRPGVLAVV